MTVHNYSNFQVFVIKNKARTKIKCIRRESNPELGHGKTQCYRYTMNACGSKSVYTIDGIVGPATTDSWANRGLVGNHFTPSPPSCKLFRL